MQAILWTFHQNADVINYINHEQYLTENWPTGTCTVELGKKNLGKK